MKLVPVTILLLILIGAAGIAANDTVTVPTSPSPSIQAGTGTGNGHRSLLLNLFRSRQSCVQTEQALREKLTTGGVVELCRGSTITLQSEIDISNMSFDLRCQKTKSLFRFRNRRPSKCVISGADQTRLFIGRPVSVVFQGIHFSNARNANGSDSGGAISILGGLANFKQCTFSANQARVRKRTSLLV